MKKIKVFLFLLMVFYHFSYSKEIPVRLIVNGDTITGAKYYLIEGKFGHLLQHIDGKIDLPDTVHYPYIILLIYKNLHAVISPPTDTRFLEIYFDNRLFNNLIKKESASRLLNLKYLFKRKCLIVYGNGMETTVFQSRKSYKYKYHLYN